MLLLKKEKNKKEPQKKNKVMVNENLINIICPAGIDYDEIHTSLGENKGKIYAVTRYPFESDYGWLSALCNLPGTSTIIEYTTADPSYLTEVYNKRISELKAERDSVKKESEKKQKQKAIDDLDKMIQRISVENEPIGYVNLMLHIQDTSEERLNMRIKKVSGIVAVAGCNIKNIKYRQGMALKAIAPYGLPDEVVANIGNRNMPLKTFLGGFPMANPGINDEGGYYLGKTTNERIILLNMWLRGKDRVNSNWVIFGLPGSGKSTILKKIFTYEYAFGTKIIMFDPEEEYIDLVNHPNIHGDVIDCAGGGNSRINPLQVRKTAKITKEDLDQGEDENDYMIFKKKFENRSAGMTEEEAKEKEAEEEEEQMTDLALYIQQLKVFFKLYFGKDEMTAGVERQLEESLIKLYKKFGIVWSTDITKLKNEDYPILKNLYTLVEERKKEEGISEYTRNNLEKLSDLLFSSGEGADRLWNGYTTLTAKSNFTDLVISGLNDADERVKRAQYYNIIMWAWQEMSKDRTEKVLFGIDEGYLVVDPDYPDLMKYLRNISKRIRKYEGGLMFITHSVVDVLDPAVKRLGQAIIDNACYKFLMGCDGKNLEETAKLFNLTEKECNILQSKSRGKGIFMAGSVRLELTVDVSDALIEMFGAAGGR